MAKDPAVLFYINDWLTSTAEMDADCRGWYLNLLLHNYDKKTLPNDMEKLAVLCNVKFSEFERFKQVFKHVLEQKFEQVDEHRITNSRTSEILKARDVFKDKRSNAGKISYVMKYFAKTYNKQYKDKTLCAFVKDNFDYTIDLKDEQVLKHVFKHLFELYINENENRNKDIFIIKNKENEKLILPFDSKEFLAQWDLWKVFKKKKFRFSYLNIESENRVLTELKNLSNNNEKTALKIIEKSIDNGWKGFFALDLNNKNNNNEPTINRQTEDTIRKNIQGW